MARKPQTAITTTQDPAPLAIQTAATRELTPAIWRMIGEMAPVMYKAHLFGTTSEAATAVIMLKGFELGLSMTAAFEFIQVIQGKPALSPRGAMALLLSNPLVEEIKITRIDNKGVFIGYECTMSRVKGFQFVGRFTMEDAMRAGLVKPDSGWAKYPENMCLWRAVGFAADVVFPDVSAGMTTLMKTPEMYGVALTEGGDVIQVEAVAVPSVDPLQELITEFGAEAVMQASIGIAANGIPQTPDEIAAVREKLSAK